MKTKRTLTDIKPCPKCGGTSVRFFKFTQYRPKEAVAKCNSCEFLLTIIGNHTDVLVRIWNDKVEYEGEKEDEHRKD